MDDVGGQRKHIKIGTEKSGTLDLRMDLSLCTFGSPSLAGGVWGGLAKYRVRSLVHVPFSKWFA